MKAPLSKRARELLKKDPRAVLFRGKNNTLLVLGPLGLKKCYLNIPKEEAINRYCAEMGIGREEFSEEDELDTIEFKDEFGAYDVYN